LLQHHALKHARQCASMCAARTEIGDCLLAKPAQKLAKNDVCCLAQWRPRVLGFQGRYVDIALVVGTVLGSLPVSSVAVGFELPQVQGGGMSATLRRRARKNCFVFHQLSVCKLFMLIIYVACRKQSYDLSPCPFEATRSRPGGNVLHVLVRLVSWSCS
jgi:hypothetical protein